MPDAHGSVRGKALRPQAFEAALSRGAVMTDLLLALDPTDTPITSYERFGIRSGAGDLVVHPAGPQSREIRLNNVLFVSSKLRAIEDFKATSRVTTSRVTAD